MGGHVHFIGKFSPKMNPFELSFLQFATCSFLSLLVSFFFEDIYLKNILSAGIPILYAGLLSVRVAYTLQLLVRKRATPHMLQLF